MDKQGSAGDSGLSQGHKTKAIHIVDSLSAGTAQGLVALSAARSAQDGASATELMTSIERWRGTTHLFGYLNSLYYVWKGGRVPRAAMWLSRLLDVKPVLELTEGKIGMVERPRTERRAMDRLIALATQKAHGAPCRVAVMHANAPERAETLADRLRGAVAPAELFITEFTPVIGAHTGPGLVGFAIQTDSPTRA